MNNTVIAGVDYGPLAPLIGVWQGAMGMDVAPEPNSDEHNPYDETLIYVAAGDVTKPEEQTLPVVRYLQLGYWLWNPATQEVIQTLTIPRGVTLLAGGLAQENAGAVIIEVAAAENSANWGITQSPFMQAKARTTSFTHRIEVSEDQLIYSETTTLDIYGKKDYPHTDQNTLQRQ
ncbi:MAG: hypothetical protein ACI9GW_002602 [Halieaceae bacterium]